MGNELEPPVDAGDDASWREDLLALRLVMTALAMRVAARAENPFEELQTIRRLALENAAATARVMHPKRDPDWVEREVDAIIGLAESRII
jgi:DNA-binding FadR family transcriptional regulator